MAIFNVSYDLFKPKQDYKDLIDEIKKTPAWAHALESTWLVSTSESADQLHKRLSKWLDSNDRILITGCTADYAGFLNKDIVEWLKKSMPQGSYS